MRKQWLKCMIFLVGCLLALPPAAHAQGSKSIVQVGTRIETHSDADSPDDYVYNIFSITRHLEGEVAGSLYYMYKHNMDSNSAGGHVIGANLIRMFSPKLFTTLGYSFSTNEKDSTRTRKTDRDRVRVGLYRKIHESQKGNRILLTAVFNTQTDWSESQTLDMGLAYKHKLTPHWTADTSFKYTRALGSLDMHVYDQWAVNFTFKLSEKTDLDIGYIFVDKTFSTPSIQPDNDNVFRMGIMHRYQ